jgi:predicted DNA-binding ribbon-helix-helix protein
MLEIERERIRSYSLEKSFWKRLRDLWQVRMLHNDPIVRAEDSLMHHYSVRLSGYKFWLIRRQT